MPDPLHAAEAIEVKPGLGRIWLGFPHYVVLGWALLISWQIWDLRNWRDVYQERTLVQSQTNAELIISMARSITALQASTRDLQDNQLRTAMILSFKFPQTARDVDETIQQEDQ